MPTFFGPKALQRSERNQYSDRHSTALDEEPCRTGDEEKDESRLHGVLASRLRQAFGSHTRRALQPRKEHHAEIKNDLYMGEISENEGGTAAPSPKSRNRFTSRGVASARDAGGATIDSSFLVSLGPRHPARPGGLRELAKPDGTDSLGAHGRGRAARLPSSGQRLFGDTGPRRGASATSSWARCGGDLAMPLARPSVGVIAARFRPATRSYARSGSVSLGPPRPDHQPPLVRFVTGK